MTEFKPVQVPTIYLIEQIGITEDYLKVEAIKDHRGNDLTMADFGDVAYITVSPERENEEIMSITNIVNTTDGKIKLVIGDRGLLPKSPYTSDSSYRKPHNSGAAVVFSNNPQFYSQFANVGQPVTVSETWTFAVSPLLTGSTSHPQNPVTNAQLDAAIALVNAGSTIAGVDDQAVAGEDIPAQTIVRYKETDGRIYIAKNTDNTIGADIVLAYTHEAVLAGQTPINGVVFTGVTQKTGLTPGKKYLGANGDIATTGDIYIGVAGDNGIFILDGEVIKNSVQEAQQGTGGIPGDTNRYVTEEGQLNNMSVKTYTASDNVLATKSDIQFIRTDLTSILGSEETTPVFAFTVMGAGTVRLKFTMTDVLAGANGSYGIFVNGNRAAAYGTLGDPSTIVSEDITLDQPINRISVYAKLDVYSGSDEQIDFTGISLCGDETGTYTKFTTNIF